jgi:hypothetical protein
LAEWLDLCIREGKVVHRDLRDAGLSDFAVGVSLLVRSLEDAVRSFERGAEERARKSGEKRREESKVVLNKGYTE